MYKFGRLYFFFCIFFSLLLFAEPLTDKSAQLEFTQNEKIWISAHPIIKVGMDPDYAPYEWTNQDGEYIGMVVDYMHRLEKSLGLRFEIIKDKSWIELLNMATEQIGYANKYCKNT